jgi:hypothetical protein
MRRLAMLSFQHRQLRILHTHFGAVVQPYSQMYTLTKASISLRHMGHDRNECPHGTQVAR